ncbi:MAG: AarF/ABC1/UbiB kinase family protein [Chloroflexi bacterium]|nr:AarF/ABC1/UbiB kinase family protein [Chloroflexota bacterium]OJV93020.1 MAG: ABC transporter [Chloroflexi bacterium 54-19]
MIKQKKTKNLGRYRQIAEVLARHGLGFLVGVLGLERFIPFHKGLLGHPSRAEPYTRPEHLRMALEELGPSFIKLGQLLSTRSDLLPQDYLVEFAKLQDQAPRVPGEQIREIVEAELGRPLNDIFVTFDLNPLAAASIGQAHAATLVGGEAVVVKVRRPGAVEQVEKDLEIFQNLAVAASKRWEVAADYDLVGLTQEFAATLRAELDYVKEGHNAERFTANFKNEPSVHIPKVFWATSTTRVLTLERLSGVKINDLAALDAAGIERGALARQATQAVLKMIFEDGFFHADLHPGNFFIEIEDGGQIGLIDFGMVGVVDERTKQQLISLFLAVTGQDADRLLEAFLEIGVTRGQVDRDLLRRDLAQLVSRYFGLSLHELALGNLIEEALAVVRRHKLQLPANLALLLKTAIMCEALGAQLDPSFRLSQVLVPYARQLIWQQYSPGNWFPKLGRSGLEAAQLSLELPLVLRRLLGELERGALEVGMQPRGFEPIVNRFEKLANRIVLSILVAAFIIGLAILLAFYHPPGLEQFAGALFVIGFGLASALGLYLAWNIIRSGRSH